MLLSKCANKAHLPASSKSLRLENWRPWASPAVSTFVNNISANATCKVQSKLLKQIQLNHLIIHQYYILLTVHIMKISWNHQLQTSKVQRAATGTKGTTEVPAFSSEDSHPSRENFAPQSHLPKGMCMYQVRFEKNRIGSRNTIWMFPNRGWGRHRSAVFRDSKPSLHLLHSQCWKDPVAAQASINVQGNLVPLRIYQTDFCDQVSQCFAQRLKHRWSGTPRRSVASSSVVSSLANLPNALWLSSKRSH